MLQRGPATLTATIVVAVTVAIILRRPPSSREAYWVINLNGGVQHLLRKRREIDLPISFTVAKKSEEALLYKKGQSRRRRAIIGRETADQAETVERNRRHAQSLEQSRIKKHKQIMTQEAENRPSEFSQLNFPEGRQASEASEASAYSGVDGSIPSDDDIEFLGTQPVQVPYTQPPRENYQVNGYSQKEKGRRTPFSSDSDTALLGSEFQNINNFGPDPPIAPPLISIEGRSQHLSMSQLPSQYRAPICSAATGTQGARGEERNKSKKLESQQRHAVTTTTEKAEKAAKRAAVAERKEVRKMAPRKEDVSQLAEQIMGSSL